MEEERWENYETREASSLEQSAQFENNPQGRITWKTLLTALGVSVVLGVAIWGADLNRNSVRAKEKEKYDARVAVIESTYRAMIDSANNWKNYQLDEVGKEYPEARRGGMNY